MSNVYNFYLWHHWICGLGSHSILFSVCNQSSSEIIESHFRTQVLSAAKVTVNVEQSKTSTIFNALPFMFEKGMHVLVLSPCLHHFSL